jgi:hypothetical protein
MKRIALITAIAAVGLPGLRANPDLPTPGAKLPPGYTSVHVSLNVLEQGTTNVTAKSLKFHFQRAHIGNDDLLGLVNDEFATSFSTTNGDQLVVSNIWDGKFSVLSKSGAVLLADASTNTDGDNYHLYFHTSRPVNAGVEKTNNASLFSVTDCHLYYESGNGTNRFHVEGFTTVDDEYSHGYTNSLESFQLSQGIGSLSFPGDGSYGVITGFIYGWGTDNAPAP